MTIQLQGDWGDAVPENLLAVLNEVARILTPHFTRSLGVVTVVPGQGVPMAAFGPHNCIFLTSRDRRWAQHSYQFAHELCHLLTNHNRLQSSPSRHFQIDEIFCETASIFTLFKMAEKWGTYPPYPNWKNYAPNLMNYAEDLMTKFSARPAGSLYEDPLNIAVNRERNGHVATKLTPLLLKYPEYWKATESFPSPMPTVGQFFQEWRRVCPDRKAVEAITDLLQNIP